MSGAITVPEPRVVEQLSRALRIVGWDGIAVLKRRNTLHAVELLHGNADLCIQRRVMDCQDYTHVYSSLAMWL